MLHLLAYVTDLSWYDGSAAIIWAKIISGHYTYLHKCSRFSALPLLREENLQKYSQKDEANVKLAKCFFCAFYSEKLVLS